MTMRSRWLQAMLWLVGGAVLAGCGTKGPLYLQPGRHLAAEPAAGGSPTVRLELFSEDFGSGQVIGGQFFSSGSRDLMVKKNEVAGALRQMVGRRLTAAGLPYAHGEGWDQTIAGLAQIPPPVRVVVDGRISRLWLEARSGLTHTNYRLAMEIVCQVGLVTEKKVVSRTVQVAEEMIKFSSQSRVMEELLEKSLAEAARQITLKVTEAVN